VKSIVLGGLLLLMALAPLRAEIHIYSMDHNNGKLIKIKEDGTLLWECPNGNGHDVQLLPNGNVLIVTGKVQEITPDKRVVWRYFVPFPYLATRLENGNTLISSGAGYGSPQGFFLVEVDTEGNTVWQYGGPDSPQEERLNWPSGFVRLPNGNTYISEALSGVIRVVSKDKKIVRVIKSEAMKHPCTLVVVDE